MPAFAVTAVQQNSNVTYRVFDYNRVSADGRLRPFHVEKALEVMDLHLTERPDFGSHLRKCDYFVVDGYGGLFASDCGTDSFHALLIMEGEGTLTCGGESRKIRKGNCLFLPAGSGDYAVAGSCKTLVTYIPPA